MCRRHRKKSFLITKHYYHFSYCRHTSIFVIPSLDKCSSHLPQRWIDLTSTLCCVCDHISVSSMQVRSVIAKPPVLQSLVQVILCFTVLFVSIAKIQACVTQLYNTAVVMSIITNYSCLISAVHRNHISLCMWSQMLATFKIFTEISAFLFHSLHMIVWCSSARVNQPISM